MYHFRVLEKREGDDYVTKPFSPGVLMAKIKGVLSYMAQNVNRAVGVDALVMLMNGMDG